MALLSMWNSLFVPRYNARGFDLNRNFPDYFKQNNKRNQPETEAIKQWLAKIQFVLSGSLHGGALVASYPYDNTPNSSMYFNLVGRGWWWWSRLLIELGSFRTHKNNTQFDSTHGIRGRNLSVVGFMLWVPRTSKHIRPVCTLCRG